MDCGNTNAVEFILNPFLRAQGVNRLSCLALTHGDALDANRELMVLGACNVGAALPPDPPRRHKLRAIPLADLAADRCRPRTQSGSTACADPRRPA